MMVDRVLIGVYCEAGLSMTKDSGQGLGVHSVRQRMGGKGMPLRYNNDKRKKPLFSRGLSVCRHLFNSFSKLKCDEKIIEKRRLFH